jgi:long-chain acyl-CoA synthetase
MGAETLIGIFLDTVTNLPRQDQFLRKTGSGWESISSQRSWQDIEALGLALRELGVQKGDRVALLSENRYEWPVTDLAILGLGAVTVPIYPTLPAAQVRYVLENSEARVAVVSNAAQLGKVSGMREGLRLEKIVAIETGGPDGAAVSFASLLERGRALATTGNPGAFAQSARAVSADDLATIIYTSGTTGEPKGAMLTHGNIAFDVWASREVIDLRSTDRVLSFLPLCHIFERMAGLYAMLSAGTSIAYAESIDTVGANAIEVRPTILCGVPRFYEKVYARVIEAGRASHGLRRTLFEWGLRVGARKARAHFERRPLPPLEALQARIADRLVAAKIRQRVGGRLRFCISGGAPLAPDVMEFFFSIGIPVIEGYGLTETSPVITLNPLGREKPGSVGPAIPGVEVRIGEAGEILTRGRHVMRGYFRNETATREAVEDGWFHTGDVGRLDEEGYLFITDRLKDLLVTAGGKKVAPQPLEARLKTSPLVTEAVLLGDRKPYVVALIVPNFAGLDAEGKRRGWTFAPSGAELERPEVRALYQGVVDAVNSDLAQFERIKSFALLDQELSQEAGELTPTLKVKRRVIMERYASTIERLYAAPAAAAVG